MGIFGAAIKGFGKALKNKKVKDKISKSAKDFVAIQKKKNKGKPDLVKQSKSPSEKEVIGYGTAAAAGLGATAVIKKSYDKKKNKPVKKAMGGEAGESLRKGKLFKDERDKRRESVDEMIERVYGKGPFDPPQIKPKLKKKPKNPNRIKPKTKPKKKSKKVSNEAELDMVIRRLKFGDQESIMLRKLAKELRKRKAASTKKNFVGPDSVLSGRSAAAKKIGSKGVKSKGINIKAGKGNPAGKDLSIAGQIKRLMNPGSRNVGEPGLRSKGTPKPGRLGPDGRIIKDKGGKRVTPLKKKRGGKVDATNLNIKKKYGKAIKERLQSKNSRAKSR